MKKLYIIASMFLIPACAKANESTIEQNVMMKAFSGYVLSLTWDEVCNGTDPKSRFENFSKSENTMLLGNRQLFGARLGGVLHVQNPDKSVDEIVQHMTGMEKTIADNARAKLNAEGCSGATAQAGAKTYMLFSKSHPAQINAFMDKSITDAGGKVTSPDEIEGKK